MFSLRIHSIDSSVSSATSTATATAGDSASTSASDSFDAGPSTTTSPRNPNPNQRFKIVRGIVHLYRNLSPSPAAASYATAVASSSSSASAALPSNDSLLPAMRGKLLFVLAIANALSPDDFVWVCDSYIQRASRITFIRNDGMEDRYSVLIEFDDQMATDRFYLELNGWRFPSSDVGEVCHVFFLVSAEFTQSLEIETTPPVGSTELPTCPICLERLDQDISGIVATTCDHSFQCSCVSKWVNSSCPVCHLCQNLSAKPTCSICETNENLWICLICGFVGCGRYKEGHAFKHWKNTQHCYSLDLETHRVWDYVGDNYVHRLNQSKGGDKLNKLQSKMEYGDSYDNCVCSEDSGFIGAILSSKIDAIVEEYNALLASQLETQRQYYEKFLIEANNQKEHFSNSVESGVNMKLHEIQQKIENVNKENKELANMNNNLTKNQNVWREKLKEIEEREKKTLKSKDYMIRDLEEQENKFVEYLKKFMVGKMRKSWELFAIRLRDFTVCIEAQKTIGKMTGADEIKGGMLLPVPSPPTKEKRSSRTNKRRN